MAIERLMEWPDLCARWGVMHRAPTLDDRPATMMQKDERAVVVALAEAAQPVRALEIGTYDGRMAAYLLQAVASIRQYVGIDLPADTMAYEKVGAGAMDQRGRLALDDSRFVLMLPVGGTAALCPDTIPRGVDLCIVDADHRYESVKRDTALALAATRPGGLVIWHDYDDEHPGVKRWIDEMAKRETITAMHALAWRRITED